MIRIKKKQKNYAAKEQKTKNKSSEKWRKEINEYLSSDLVDETVEILSWWRNHQNVYLNLARMAPDFLGIQATSVPVERLFSRSFILIRKHINRLNSDIARELLCINDWTTKKITQVSTA